MAKGVDGFYMDGANLFYEVDDPGLDEPEIEETAALPVKYIYIFSILGFWRFLFGLSWSFFLSSLPYSSLIQQILLNLSLYLSFLSLYLLLSLALSTHVSSHQSVYHLM